MASPCSPLLSPQRKIKRSRESPDGAVVRVAQWQRTHLPMQEMRVRSLGQEDPLEKGMATHTGFLGWEIPWTEEPGGL